MSTNGSPTDAYTAAHPAPEELDPYDQSMMFVQGGKGKINPPKGTFPPVRTFASGANRDQAGDKFDYEGFLSPTVIQRFGAYMHKHRTLADGSIRESDNWQKGIPLNSYMKSMMRHVHAIWMHHRGDAGPDTEPLEEALCAVLFNAQGYLHETLAKVPDLATVWPDHPEGP